MALTAEQIAQIYANRRTKGEYLRLMAEFIASGENGVSVKEQWPQLESRKPQTIKQGFEGAKDKKDSPEGADQVDVIVEEGTVYLLNRATLGELAPPVEAPEAEAA